MNKIVAAVDFSEASFNAVSYAAYLANYFNGTLVVVNAYTNTDAIDDVPLMEVYDSGQDLEEANQKYLETQMNILIRKYTVKIKGIVMKGKPVKVIKQVAKNEKASLIVMGMKGRGKSNSIFGSTTISMISETQLPIIVVPEKASYKPLQNIVVAIDFRDKKPVSRFKVLNELIKKYDPFLQILNVQKKDSELTPEMISGKMRSGLIWDKYNHSFNIIESENVEEGINQFLKKNPADMLAMVAKKHRLLERIFNRSHTRTMMRQTKIPLLVMHPPKETEKKKPTL